MSAGSISDLPVHYGEVQKDGTRITRPSEEPSGRQSPRGGAISLDHQRSSKPDADLHPPLGEPEQDIPVRDSKDQPRLDKGLSTGRTDSRRLGGLDGRRAFPGQGEYRQNLREWRRYDDYAYFNDHDDMYDDYERPRHVQERAYFPEDEYRPRRQPSRSSHYTNGALRVRRRRSLEYQDDIPQTPRRYYSQKESRANRGPPLVEERSEDDDEGEAPDGYVGDKSQTVKPNLRFRDLTREEKKEIMRLPWTHWMGSSTKNHFVATLGEFIGTTMFLWFAFAGTQVANIPSGESADNSTSGGATGFSAIVLLYIAIVFGFSLMVNVWVFFRISGGLFNPAVSNLRSEHVLVVQFLTMSLFGIYQVTLAMWMTSAVEPVRAICLVAAQVAGSIAASALVLVQFPTALNVRTTLAGGTSLVQGIFIEAVLTAELVFTILMLAKEKHKATFIAPVGIGLALFIAELVGVFYTGGSLNPARSLGPCVVTRTFDAEHWIYWVGPGVGALAAVLFYKVIKILEYEVANPGQDAEDTTEAARASQDKRKTISEGRIQ